jgi:hypothetical protein
MTLPTPAVHNIVLRYTSFKQITDDISDARVCVEIHYRTDRWQELAWARLSAKQSTSTTCAPCTTMTATMIVMMTK